MKLNVPGLLKSKYMTYMIEVKNSGSVMERRYSDFANLRQELIKSYPGYIIPPIPKKKMGKTTEAAFLNKRQELLRQFLNEIVSHPVLKNSQLVTEFLTLSKKDWEKKIKILSKLPGARDVSGFRTAEGSANIELTEEKEKYCEKIQPLLDIAKEKYKVIKGYNKSIMNEFDRLGELFLMSTTSYTAMANTFSSLGDNTSSILYGHIGDIHKRLGETYKVFKQIVMTELVSYYRFHKYEIGALIELIVAQRNACVMANSLEKKLWNKKESKFAQKNIATWDLNPATKAIPEALLNDKRLAFQEMLYKETVEARKARILYGYYTNKVKEEFTRITKKNWISAKNHFGNTSSLFIDREQELKNIWEDFLNKMKSLKLGTSLGELRDMAIKIA